MTRLLGSPVSSNGARFVEANDGPSNGDLPARVTRREHFTCSNINRGRFGIENLRALLRRMVDVNRERLDAGSERRGEGAILNLLCKPAALQF